MSFPIVRCNHLLPGTDVLSVMQSAQQRPMKGAQHQSFAVVEVAGESFFIQGQVAPHANDIVRLHFSNGANLEGRVIAETTGLPYAANMAGRWARGALIVAAGAAAAFGLSTYGFDAMALGAGAATFLGLGLYKHNLTRKDDFIERHTKPLKPVNEGGRAEAVWWEPTDLVYAGDAGVVQAHAA